MTALQLISRFSRLGIRLEANGDRLRFSPPSLVTPDLAQRLKEHKAEILTILRQDGLAPVRADPETVETQRVAGANCPNVWEAEFVDEFLEVIEPPEACANCRTLELWQTSEGNWRCLRCDPPTRSRELQEWVSQGRRQVHRHRSGTDP